MSLNVATALLLLCRCSQCSCCTVVPLLDFQEGGIAQDSNALYIPLCSKPHNVPQCQYHRGGNEPHCRNLLLSQKRCVDDKSSAGDWFFLISGRFGNFILLCDKRCTFLYEFISFASAVKIRMVLQRVCYHQFQFAKSS